MIRHIVDSRPYLSIILTVGIGTLLNQRFPFTIPRAWQSVAPLNFPVAMNPGLAQIIRTLMKQDFQRAILNRIPMMEIEPAHRWREIVFLCDEYQSFATVGESANSR